MNGVVFQAEGLAEISRRLSVATPPDRGWVACTLAGCKMDRGGFWHPFRVRGASDVYLTSSGRNGPCMEMGVVAFLCEMWAARNTGDSVAKEDVGWARESSWRPK